MTRRAIYISTGGGAAILLCALWWWSGPSPDETGVISSTDRSAFRAATSPTTMSGLLPEEYSVLITRNPFGGRGRGGGPEASLVFKGVILSGLDYLAFFEDASTKNVTRMKVGEKVARGRIKSMDLDGLVYETADGSRRIEVGQNLNGETPPPPPPPATKPASPAGPPGGPAAAARGRRGGPQPQPGPPQPEPVPMPMDGEDP